jgi:hypothetical protein
VYRHQLRPILRTGAVVMDPIFEEGRGMRGRSHSVSQSARISAVWGPYLQ